MQLDIPTLMVMGSFVSAYAGTVLFVAWLQHPKTPALAWWALADLIAGAGILCLMLGSASRQPAWFVLSGALLALSPGLMWKAARIFDAKRAPLSLVFLGVALVVVANGVSGLRDIAESLSLAAGFAYSLAAAVAFWLRRKDGLVARRAIIALAVFHAAVLAAGVYSTLHGTVAQNAPPPVVSLFGLIHFEAIIFAVGTAVFILALVKERAEAAIAVAARTDGLTGIANRAAFM